VAKVTFGREQAGRLSVTVTARQLQPGRYQRTARYPGANPYAGSTSPNKALTVTK
jgi:hypothetical protein